MAKITIELDTNRSEDEAFLIALGRAAGDNRYERQAQWQQGPAKVISAEVEERPTQAEPQTPEAAAPAKRKGRPPKTEPAPSGEPATDTAETTESPATPTDDEVPTLEVVNAKIKELFDRDVPALKIQEVFKLATDGKFGSARQINEAGEQHHFVEIMKALEAL